MIFSRACSWDSAQLGLLGHLSLSLLKGKEEAFVSWTVAVSHAKISSRLGLHRRQLCQLLRGHTAAGLVFLDFIEHTDISH